MGLENLKSAFSNIEKMDRTNLSDMTSEFQSGPAHPENDSIYNPEMPTKSEFQSGPTHALNDGVYNPGNILKLQPSDYQSGPVHPENDSIYNPADMWDLQPSRFQSGPAHPENDGIYNPVDIWDLQPSRFQSGPTHPENDGIYNPFPLLGLTSEFQSGPTHPENDGIYNPVDMSSKVGDSEFTVGPKHSKNDGIYIPVDMSTKVGDSEFSILNEYQRFNFVSDNQSLYENYFYDPRTQRPRTRITKNGYPGTKFDKLNFSGGGEIGIGGSFNRNGVDYSLAFRNINSGNLEEIISAGNYGQGHGLVAQTAYSSYALSQTQQVESYYDGGVINSSNSSWYSGGASNGVMPPNANVTYEAHGTETRTVSLDGVAIQAQELLDTGGWKKLYNADGSSKGVGYSYPNVDQSKLRYGATNTGFRGDEPYVRRDIGESKWGGRDAPFTRGIEDVERLGKFLFSSNAGGSFFLKQNLLGIMASLGSNSYRKFYNPLSATMAALNAGITMGGGVMQMGLGVNRNELFDSWEENFNIGYTTYLDRRAGALDYHQGEITPTASLSTTHQWSKKNVNRMLSLRGGDPLTLKPPVVANAAQLNKTNVADAEPDLESEANGMPMYFNDLSANQRIYFRAFVEGMVVNYSPSWQTTNYPGASQPVYTYDRTEKDISFTLKMAAGSRSEYTQIWAKVNRLQKMVRPTYKVDSVRYMHKLRMKPPFIEIRIGELIGSKNQAQLGFMKSLNITVPESATWETDPAIGRRPKFITAAISFQCISRGMPSNLSNIHID